MRCRLKLTIPVTQLLSESSQPGHGGHVTAKIHLGNKTTCYKHGNVIQNYKPNSFNVMRQYFNNKILV